MKPTIISRPRVVLFAVMALAVQGAFAQTLTAPAARISDQAIVADQAGYKALQQRVKALNDKGVPVNNYYLSKAQCWLDVSLHEYTRNDRSAFPQQALAQGAAIVGALETGATPNPGDQTPLVNDAAKLREDLWTRFGAVKSGAGLGCAAQKVACGEVELVHAGNEFNQQGWRHANPYIQIAEDQLQAAQASAAACGGAPVVVSKIEAGAVPAPTVVVEKLTLAADALFRFDKSGLPDLLPAGRARIDSMMIKLDGVYAQISGIKLTGYTDRLGTEAYNQPLSERRAATVRAYLVSKGFAGEIVSAGKGEADQVEACTGVAPRAALIGCLQPNRRVEVEVTGIKR
ncbi:OmpA family protein [Massilia antarctica]|uniref:OmpA family protein n=1 Tax=Massilia antarctica TaxID=2765360 RepID=UPI0022721506|nr:OmpA family protein [Massilia sp. H27-R4]MCY0910641.1 OmpA family protein [Massilia sp. H27-R4]